jgi:hypothetical protein
VGVGEGAGEGGGTTICGAETEQRRREALAVVREDLETVGGTAGKHERKLNRCRWVTIFID